MSEEHESWRLFGKGEGAFQLGTGERKTYVTRLEERLWGRSRVHWGPPEDTVRGFRSDRGLGIVEQRTMRCTLQESPLHTEGPGLRRFIRRFESGVGVDRLHGGRAVDVQHGIELPGQDGVEVVTESLCFWLVNDADRALQARF